MITFLKYKLNRIALRIAATCFSVGTLIMLISLMENNEILVNIVMVFLIISIPVNCILFIFLFVHTLANIRGIIEHVLTAVLVLLNCPIAILYSYFLNL